MPTPEIAQKLEPEHRYWCCWCARKVRGDGFEGHLKAMHPDMLKLVEEGKLLGIPEVFRAWKKKREFKQKDIKGQTFFPFLFEHWKRPKGND